VVLVAAAHIDKLDFVTISKKVSTKKGSYLRFAKETILKIREDEERKVRDDETNEKPRIHPPGAALDALSEDLARLSGDPKCSNLEVYLLGGKVDQEGQKIIHDGRWIAEIRSFGIYFFNEETKALLKQEFEKSPVLSVLVLWTRYGAGKLGILKLKPVPKNGASLADEYEEWEGRAIAAYLHRHNL
jgi:hypothetical protein